MTALADTTVIIDHLRGVDAATRVVFDAVANSKLVISRLTLVELASGMRPHQREAYDVLMRFVEIVDVTEDIGVRAEQLASTWGPSHRAIDAIDYVIAATAEIGDTSLLTTNIRHFPMFDGLVAPY